jgi:hypothetical protein
LAAPAELPLGWLLAPDTRAAMEDNDRLNGDDQLVAVCNPSPTTPLNGLLKPELTRFDALAHKCALLGRIMGETMLPLKSLGEGLR